MNPWHVALVHKKEGPLLCHLSPVTDDQLSEPYRQRVYRCLVKWRDRPRLEEVGNLEGFDFLDLQFDRQDEYYYSAKVVDPEFLSLTGLPSDNEVAKRIQFALSGKPIIRKKAEIPLANVIDRFQDVRHIFNLPTVPASGAFHGMPINQLNFGEYYLYRDPNVRRAALNSPVVIDLALPESGVQVRLGDLKETLDTKHYRFDEESPTRRGRYRIYSNSSVEIFYPHNVYPFGVIGGRRDDLVALASGGLSGRVGNTLEGISRMMHDFFGCEDAIVLDEGYDTFLIVNPNRKKKQGDPDDYAYDNTTFLQKVARFTKWMADQDAEKYGEPTNNYALDPDGVGMKKWPLNERLFAELDTFCQDLNPEGPEGSDIIAVPPNRSQMRAVLIVAKERTADGSKAP